MSGKVVRLSVNGSMLFLHHCFCRLLGLKAQLSAELCPSSAVSLMSHIDRLGEDREWNPGRNRGQEGYGRWERKEPEVGGTERIGNGRIWQQCLNKEQGGSPKQNKK